MNLQFSMHQCFVFNAKYVCQIRLSPTMLIYTLTMISVVYLLNLNQPIVLSMAQINKY